MATIGFASPIATSQISNPNIIFDDFNYTNTNWCNELDYTSCNSTHLNGSLYGYSTWRKSIANSTTENSRMWYQFEWQETSDIDSLSSIIAHGNGNNSTDSYIEILSGPGHRRDSASYPSIISGHTSRRGTWSAWVNFSRLPDMWNQPGDPATIQAYWLISRASSYPYEYTQSEKDDKFFSFRWNEIDFEWNDSFHIDAGQYLSTGYTVGDFVGVPPSGVAPVSTHEPLISHWWPDGNDDNGVDDDQMNQWECKYVENDIKTGMTGYVLLSEDCGRLLIGESITVTQSNNQPKVISPSSDPWAQLFFQVTDSGVRFEIASHGWGGTLLAYRESDRITNLPLATAFSQTISKYLPADSSISLKIDWSYFSPDTSLNINSVFQDVEYIRQQRINRLNTSNASVQRPSKPLPGAASSWGYGFYTTPLSIDIIAPNEYTPNSTHTIVALPPLRQSMYRYEWKYRTHNGCNTSYWSNPIIFNNGGWDMDFRFDKVNMYNADKVEFEVTISDLLEVSSIDDSTKMCLESDGLGHYDATYLSRNGWYRTVCSPNLGYHINGSVAKLHPISRRFTIKNSNSPAATCAKNVIDYNFTVHTAYPNPASSIINLEYQAPVESDVRLSMFDIIGRKIMTVENKNRTNPNGKIIIPTVEVPPGSYILTITSDNITRSQLVSIIR